MINQTALNKLARIEMTEEHNLTYGNTSNINTTQKTCGSFSSHPSQKKHVII